MPLIQTIFASNTKTYIMQASCYFHQQCIHQHPHGKIATKTPTFPVCYIKVALKNIIMLNTLSQEEICSTQLSAGSANNTMPTALFVWACLAYKPYFFSQRTVFFFHTKSANSTFSHGLSVKQAQAKRANVTRQ